ncbi:hypothetical protein DFH06DRAFT_1300399 [Mycena polygramma]|nr:hypothetical protein DFH06DRAFT_1300399 [Mycena polygramma]
MYPGFHPAKPLLRLKLPVTAPHWPLQAPQDYIKKYHGVYAGTDALPRLKRLAKLQELGLLSRDIVRHPVVADEVKACQWAYITNYKRALKSARAMEVVANGGVHRNVGKVHDFVERSGELDNTFVRKRWHLFNLPPDPGETGDLADKLARLILLLGPVRAQDGRDPTKPRARRVHRRGRWRRMRGLSLSIGSRGSGGSEV